MAALRRLSRGRHCSRSDPPDGTIPERCDASFAGALRPRPLWVPTYPRHQSREIPQLRSQQVSDAPVARLPGSPAACSRSTAAAHQLRRSGETRPVATSYRQPPRRGSRVLIAASTPRLPPCPSGRARPRSAPSRSAAPPRLASRLRLPGVARRRAVAGSAEPGVDGERLDGPVSPVGSTGDAFARRGGAPAARDPAPRACRRPGRWARRHGLPHGVPRGHGHERRQWRRVRRRRSDLRWRRGRRRNVQLRGQALHGHARRRLAIPRRSPRPASPGCIS
jgi:hypothetical protein